ncbi:hypothetical protein J6590_037599 [Homalodisca vitripennis]|nr:hypothetical protein J6590_037599 [Homalodisca vitripennis]
MGINYMDVETAMEYVGDLEESNYLFQVTMNPFRRLEPSLQSRSIKLSTSSCFSTRQRTTFFPAPVHFSACQTQHCDPLVVNAHREVNTSAPDISRLSPSNRGWHSWGSMGRAVWR